MTAPSCQTRVTVVDVLRIARTLVLEPWEFTRLMPAPAITQPVPFVLDDSGAWYQLVLGSAISGDACPFLLHAIDGAICCGLDRSTRPLCRRPAGQYDAVDLSIHAAVAQGWNAYACRWHKDTELNLADLSRYALDVASVLAEQQQAV